MDVLEVIRKRFSCRAYKDKKIEKKKLDVIMEAARLAPSARNMQDWRFVVLTQRKARRQIAAITNRPEVFQKAGAIIVACSNSDYVMRCGQAISSIDVAIALEHICLQATDLGLGACWIGSFDPEKVASVLGIPGDIQIIELMAIGYPDEARREPDRQPIENIVCYEKWKF